MTSSHRNAETCATCYRSALTLWHAPSIFNFSFYFITYFRYGDLSADVDITGESGLQGDWDKSGLTFAAFAYALPGLEGGLSSRYVERVYDKLHSISVCGAKICVYTDIAGKVSPCVYR